MESPFPDPDSLDTTATEAVVSDFESVDNSTLIAASIASAAANKYPAVASIASAAAVAVPDTVIVVSVAESIAVAVSLLFLSLESMTVILSTECLQYLTLPVFS